MPAAIASPPHPQGFRICADSWKLKQSCKWCLSQTTVQLMSSLVLIFFDTKKIKKLKKNLKKLNYYALTRLFSSTPQQPTKEKNRTTKKKKKKKIFHNFCSPLQLFLGGWAPPSLPPMGVLCGVQRYYNFSTLVDGDDLYLEYMSWSILWTGLLPTTYIYGNKF